MFSGSELVWSTPPAPAVPSWPSSGSVWNWKTFGFEYAMFALLLVGLVSTGASA